MNNPQRIVCANMLKEASSRGPTVNQATADMNAPKSESELYKLYNQKYFEYQKAFIAQGMPAEQAAELAKKRATAYTAQEKLSGENTAKRKQGLPTEASLSPAKPVVAPVAPPPTTGDKAATFIGDFSQKAFDNPMLFAGAPTIGAVLGTYFAKNHPIFGGLAGGALGLGAAYLADDLMRKPPPSVPSDPTLNVAPPSIESNMTKKFTDFFDTIKSKFTNRSQQVATSPTK